MCAGEGREPVTDLIISISHKKEECVILNLIIILCVVFLEFTVVPDRRECKLCVRALNSNSICIRFTEEQRKI